MRHTQQITSCEFPKLESADDNFMYWNKALARLKFPKLKFAGTCFLAANQCLTECEFHALKIVEDFFLYCNETLEVAEMPKLEFAGVMMLHSNQKIDVKVT